jgi:hypothetical protein
MQVGPSHTPAPQPTPDSRPTIEFTSTPTVDRWIKAE